MIPLEFESKPGYWQDDFTFNKSLYRLNDAKACIVEVKLQRQEVKRLNDENNRVKLERDIALIDLKMSQDEVKTQQEKNRLQKEDFDRSRLQWNADMSAREAKHYKTIFRIVGISVGVSFLTWLAGKLL